MFNFSTITKTKSGSC